MEIWVEPLTGRIKAIYRVCSTSSRVWVDKGYEKHDRIELWMLPMEPPAPTPIEPTKLIGEDGKEYIIGVGGVVKPKPVEATI